jgi:hypothetical protein
VLCLDPVLARSRFDASDPFLTAGNSLVGTGLKSALSVAIQSTSSASPSDQRCVSGSDRYAFD